MVESGQYLVRPGRRAGARPRGGRLGVLAGVRVAVEVGQHHGGGGHSEPEKVLDDPEAHGAVLVWTQMGTPVSW